LATGSGGAQTTRGGPLAPGSYECWAFSSPRMGLNFTITGPGAYRGAEGGTGAFSYDAATGAITFTSGPLAGAMPTGFRVIYEVRRGKPTVSFVGTSGAEASFCEKV
jgi:hypothetical protein